MLNQPTKPNNSIRLLIFFQVFLAFLLMLSSGCANKGITPIQYVPSYKYFAECQKPTKGKKKLYNPSKSLGNKDNVAILLYNEKVTEIYITGLEATVNCYEAQVRQKDTVENGKDSVKNVEDKPKE